MRKGVRFLHVMRIFTEGITSTSLIDALPVYSTPLHCLPVMDHRSRHGEAAVKEHEVPAPVQLPFLGRGRVSKDISGQEEVYC